MCCANRSSKRAITVSRSFLVERDVSAAAFARKKFAPQLHCALLFIGSPDELDVLCRFDSCFARLNLVDYHTERSIRKLYERREREREREGERERRMFKARNRAAWISF